MYDMTNSFGIEADYIGKVIVIAISIEVAAPRIETNAITRAIKHRPE